jgi:hypothetical protein
MLVSSQQLFVSVSLQEARIPAHFQFLNKGFVSHTHMVKSKRATNKHAL